jgi:hypothetical protein
MLWASITLHQIVLVLSLGDVQKKYFFREYNESSDETMKADERSGVFLSFLSSSKIDGMIVLEFAYYISFCSSSSDFVFIT